MCQSRFCLSCSFLALLSWPLWTVFLCRQECQHFIVSSTTVPRSVLLTTVRPSVCSVWEGSYPNSVFFCWSYKLKPLSSQELQYHCQCQRGLFASVPQQRPFTPIQSLILCAQYNLWTEADSAGSPFWVQVPPDHERSWDQEHCELLVFSLANTQIE